MTKIKTKYGIIKFNLKERMDKRDFKELVKHLMARQQNFKVKF
jgi:uncharacterized protein YdhG (YjbR/CyaY superfamily)